jgi:hypothetical protein
MLAARPATPLGKDDSCLPICTYVVRCQLGQSGTFQQLNSQSSNARQATSSGIQPSPYTDLPFTGSIVLRLTDGFYREA